MKHPNQWTRKDLHHHLQQAIDLEFWTIPLYLTSLYSIKNLHKTRKADFPASALLIESVVIQEMLHLEIVCNISNALGYSPVFHAPFYDDHKRIPFVHPAHLPNELKDYKVMPGPLDENSLKLFCVIEFPESTTERTWNEIHTYDSIAQLYEALRAGIQTLWGSCYVGNENNTRQKVSFMEYQQQSGRHFGFSQFIDSPESAIKAIEAIVEQGEGAHSAFVPVEFRPPENEPGKEFDPGWFKGNLSHYQKFRMLLHHLKKLPPVYETRSDYIPGPAQENLNESYRKFLEELTISFHSEGEKMSNEFWHHMFALSKAITYVWEDGGCPDFNIQNKQIQN